MSLNCPICGRDLILGPTVDEHHLLPKTHSNRNKEATELSNLITIHRVCHNKIHSTLSENELYRYYNTIDRIKKHPEIQKFIKWVQKKDPEYIDTHKDTKERKRKRRK